MYRSIRFSHRILTAVVSASMLLVMVPAASTRAANIPIYDVGVTRERVVNDPTLSPIQLYLSNPWYVDLPGQSLSTPTIIGQDLYQYTYSGGTGTLYDITMPTLNPTAVLQQYGAKPPAYLTAPTTVVRKLVFANVGDAAAQSQDSLATSQGWQSIAVGRTLYAWPQGQWPAAPTRAGHWIIWPSPGNTQFMVDMSPIITPPVTVKVYSIPSMRVEAMRLPMAVACSWDGGCVGSALGAPADTFASAVQYHTTQDFPSDADTAITSDPAFIAHEPLFGKAPGDPAVVFGVASWSHPRLELLDLETGKAKAIGVGVIAAPVADAVMVDTTGSQPLIVAHDEYGAVYSFNLYGRLVSIVTPQRAGRELGEDAAATVAHAVLQPADSAKQMLVAPVSGSSDDLAWYADYTGLSSPSTLIGSDPSFPCSAPGEDCRYTSVWSFSSFHGAGVSTGPGILLMPIAALGGAYINRPTYSTGGEMIAAKTSPYVGVLIDGGPQHDLVSWTNGAPTGSGAIALWVPINYTMEASAPPTAPSSDQVTVTGVPIPAGVTHDRILNATCNNSTTGSPVSMELTSSLGTSGWLALNRTNLPTVSYPWSKWTGQWSLPANTTGKPVTWTVQVSGVDKFCQAATATTSFVEEPGAAPQSGPLTLNPNPALYGQTVSASLSPVTPAAPTPPQGKVTAWSWRIESATLYWPQVNPKMTFSVPFYPSNYGKTAAMALSQHSAVYRFSEDWWDGGGQTLAGINVPILSDAGSWTPGAVVPNGQPIPSLTSPVRADYSLQESYTYTWQTTSTEWRANPACTSTDPPKTCNSKGETPVPVLVRHTATSSVTLPQQSVQVQIEVDGSALDRVGGGG